MKPNLHILLLETSFEKKTKIIEDQTKLISSFTYFKTLEDKLNKEAKREKEKIEKQKKKW